jgi:hypothetical protein
MLTGGQLDLHIYRVAGLINCWHRPRAPEIDKTIDQSVTSDPIPSPAEFP